MSWLDPYEPYVQNQDSTVDLPMLSIYPFSFRPWYFNQPSTDCALAVKLQGYGKLGREHMRSLSDMTKKLFLVTVGAKH